MAQWPPLLEADPAPPHPAVEFLGVAGRLMGPGGGGAMQCHPAAPSGQAWAALSHVGGLWLCCFSHFGENPPKIQQTQSLLGVDAEPSGCWLPSP